MANDAATYIALAEESRRRALQRRSGMRQLAARLVCPGCQRKQALQAYPLEGERVWYCRFCDHAHAERR